MSCSQTRRARCTARRGGPCSPSSPTLPNSVTSQRREQPVIFHYGSTAGSAPGRDRFPSSYSIMAAATSSGISTPTTTSAGRSQMSRDAASSRSITGLRPSTNSPPPSKTPPLHCTGSCRKRKTFRSTRRALRSAATALAAIYRQTWHIFRTTAKYLSCASRCFFIPGRT